MAGQRSREAGSLERFRRSLRRGDEASASMVTFIVGTSAFIVSTAVLIHFVAEPPGGTSGLEQAELKARAANALEILLQTHGYPAAWSEDGFDLTTLDRLGLLEMGSSIRVDPAKFDKVANGSVWNPSSTNGAVDYTEMKENLSLDGYDFHLRAYPLFEPFDSDSYGVEGMEDFRVAYIGDWSGGAEQTSSDLERDSLDALPVDFTNTVRTAVLGTGDVYKDDGSDLRNYLVPLLGAAPAQTVIGPGNAATAHSFSLVDADVYSAILTLETDESRALAMVSEDAEDPTSADLGYTKNRELRVVLGLANMSSMTVSASLAWKEYVDTTGDAGDYGWVEVSPDNGTTWYQLTNVAGERSDHSTLAGWESRSKTISAANCAACLGKNEVWVAFHWQADNDAASGKGWIVDDVTLTSGLTTTFNKNFESPEYDMLVVGSNVDQNAFTAAETKNAIRDYVEQYGGRLLVLGGQTNTNWLQPLFHVGVRDATPGVSSPDATHPLLTVPNELAWEEYSNNDKAWDFTGGDAEALFNMVVGDGDDEHVLSVSASGAFGDSSADGVVMLTTYLPYLMESEQSLSFIANILTYGRYHRLYMEAGPEVPDGVPVAAATRTATMDKTRVDAEDFIEMAFILYIWQGSGDAVTTASGTEPSAPLSLSATAANGQVTLSWDPPESYGSGEVINYKIYRGTMAYVETYLAATGGTNTSFVDHRVTNGVTYYYNVTAVSAVGEGDSSSRASATPSTVPGAPLALSATGLALAVSLDWDAPTSNGGAAVTAYHVWRATALAGPYSLVGQTTDTSYSDTSLSGSSTYYYTVAAENARGHGSNTSAVSATTLGGTSTPSAPLLPSATGGTGEISLSWSEPLSDGGDAITDYKVYRGTSSGALALLASTGGTNTSFVDAEAETNTTYYYEVRAVNAAGEGDASTEVSATTDGVPYPPTALLATGGVGMVTLTWLAPAEDGGEGIDGYLIERKTDAGGAWGTLTTVGAVLTHNDGTAAAGTTYYYRVSAINAVGTGNPSNEDDGQRTL